MLFQVWYNIIGNLSSPKTKAGSYVRRSMPGSVVRSMCQKIIDKYEMAIKNELKISALNRPPKFKKITFLS